MTILKTVGIALGNIVWLCLSFFVAFLAVWSDSTSPFSFYLEPMGRFITHHEIVFWIITFLPAIICAIMAISAYWRGNKEQAKRLLIAATAPVLLAVLFYISDSI